MPELPANETPSTSSAAPPAERAAARRAALRISLLYLASAMIWITASDAALTYLAATTGNPLGLITRFQMVKGWFFVIVTSGLLFLVVRSFIRSIQKAERQRHLDLARTASAYQLLFQSNPLALWVYDIQTYRILAGNGRALSTYGYSRDEFLERVATDLHPPEAREEARKVLDSKSGPDGKRSPGVWRHCRKDGNTFDAEISSHDILFEGRQARLVLTIDVTDRMKAERAFDENRAQLEDRVALRTRELSLANEKLKAEAAEREHVEAQLRAATVAAQTANTAKSAFLANTSHEVRTPLTSILGYTDLLLDSEMTADQRERHITVIQQNAAHLLTLIDDLLDLSHTEMGKMTITMGDYSPAEVAQQTVELLRPRADEKELALSLHVVGELPATIKTDGVRLRQVLTTLASNAIKFTSNGEISVTVRCDAAAENPSVNFEIKDTGIGIQEQHLHRIFEPFYQVEQSADRRFGGTGLGLAISRQLTEQMGGTVNVASTPGSGSTFTVTIPVTQPPAAAPRRESAPQRAAEPARIGGHVLLAEDNANVRWLVEEYLRRTGATVTAVSNGIDAVKVATDALAGGNGKAAIELILMDIHMPGMDGLEATGRIRAAGYRGPIVAITAHLMSSEEAKLIGAGCDAIAAKPIDLRTFIPLLSRLIEARKTPAK